MTDATHTTGTDIASRYRRVSDGFTSRINGVDPPVWDNTAPCDGWTARDIVIHLVEWVPAVMRQGAALEFPELPSPGDDPAAAWSVVDTTLRSVLDDPARSALPFSHPHAGDHRLDEAIGMLVLGDLLIHTWDLARATGQDETLDPDEVVHMYEGILGIDELLRSSGQYGPKVAVASDADVQAKLIAFVGRQP